MSEHFFTEEELKSRAPVPLTTGSPTDKLLPLFKGNMYILTGTSGVGKSTFSYYWASLCTHLGDVIYLSTEVAAPVVYGFTSRRFKGFEKVKFLREDYIDPALLCPAIREVKPLFVFIDVLDDLLGFEDIKSTGLIMQSLCEVAKVTDCVIIGVSHLKKNVGGGGLQMTDLKGSSVIYQKPSGIVGIEPTPVLGERKLKLLKPSRVPVAETEQTLTVALEKKGYVTIETREDEEDS